MIIGQIFGLLAFFVFTLGMAEGNRTRYYFLFGLSSLIFAVHYALLGEYMLVPIAVLAFFRTTILCTVTGWKYRFITSGLCAALAVFMTLSMEVSVWSVLFVVSCVLTSLSEVMGHLNLIRLNNVSQRILYLAYYCVIFSVGGILSELVALGAIIYGYTRDKGLIPVIAGRIRILLPKSSLPQQAQITP